MFCFRSFVFPHLKNLRWLHDDSQFDFWLMKSKSCKRDAQLLHGTTRFLKQGWKKLRPGTPRPTIYKWLAINWMMVPKPLYRKWLEITISIHFKLVGLGVPGSSLKFPDPPQPENWQKSWDNDVSKVCFFFHCSITPLENEHGGFT